MYLSESASEPIEVEQSLKMGKEDSKIMDNKYFDIKKDNKLYILELSKSKAKDYISLKMSNYLNIKDNYYFFNLTIEKFREIYKLNSLFQNIDEIYGLLVKLIIDEDYHVELKFNSIVLLFKFPMLIGEAIEAKFELKPKILNKQEIIENLCSKVSELITENQNIKNEQKAIYEELRNKNNMLEGELEKAKFELDIMKKQLENILGNIAGNINYSDSQQKGYDNLLRGYEKRGYLQQNDYQIQQQMGYSQQTDYPVQQQMGYSPQINNQVQQQMEYSPQINNQVQQQMEYSQPINNQAQQQIEYSQPINNQVQQKMEYSQQINNQAQLQRRFSLPISNQFQQQRRFSLPISNQFQQQIEFSQPINNQAPQQMGFSEQNIYQVQQQMDNSQPNNSQVQQQMGFSQQNIYQVQQQMENSQPINNQVQQQMEYSGENQFQNQKGFSQEGRFENQQLFPEPVHEHSVNYFENLNEYCKLCLENIGGQPGYKCGECPIIYCLKCAKKIIWGSKNKSVHSHSLLLKDTGNRKWKCDICQNQFKGKASFYCKQCDFDACDKCYLK